VGERWAQGSAEFADVKPEQKMRATTDHAAETPAWQHPCGAQARGSGFPGELPSVPAPSVTWPWGKGQTLAENVMEGDTKEQRLQEGAAEN